eukprot:2837091-Amphidinium_carterae.1
MLHIGGSRTKACQKGALSLYGRLTCRQCFCVTYAPAEVAPDEPQIVGSRDSIEEIIDRTPLQCNA